METIKVWLKNLLHTNHRLMNNFLHKRCRMKIMGEMTKIGFVDKNGVDLKVGHTVKTFDSKGKKWIGKIVPEDPKRIVAHPFLKSGRTLYMFESNYGTWISDQKYASELEII